MIVAVVVAVVVVASERAIRASAAFPLKVLAASGCSLANILLWKSVLLLSRSRCRIYLPCYIVILLGVLLAADASALSCWGGTQTFMFSSDTV